MAETIEAKGENPEDRKVEVRRPKSKLVRCGAVVLAAAAATVAATLIGTVIGDGFDSEDVSDLNRVRDRAASANIRLDEAETVLANTRVEIGEVCVAAAKNYVAGGELADVDEDLVVTDLLNNPNQPCGDNATQARIAFRKYEEATSGVSSAESTATWANSDLASQEPRLLTDVASDEASTGTLVGLAVGGLVAGAAAFSLMRRIIAS